MAVVDRADKSVAWTYKTDGPVRTAPMAGKTYVVVGSEDRSLHAVSEGGELLWKCPTGNRVVVPATIAGGRVYFGSDDQLLYALSVD